MSVTIYRDGLGNIRRGTPPADPAPYGRDGFGQPLKSPAPADTSAPYGRDGFGQPRRTPLPAAPAAPFGLDGLGQPRRTPAPADSAPFGRDGLGQPLRAPVGGGTGNVLQGPGRYGPLGSASQVYGMLKNGLNFDGEDNTPGEMDVYSPLGNIGSILQGILRGSGSGSGRGRSGSKPTISRAVLQKALKAAKKEIAGAYDAATPAVAAAYATNPYAGMQAQETVADPGLSALFQSQGVSTNPLEQMLATNREASSQRTSALNDMYKLMAAQFAQQGTQQQADIAQQRAGSLDDLLQNYALVLGSGKVY